MTVSATEAATSDVYFDPYDVDINADPYPTFRRLRDEVAAVLQHAARLLRAQPVRRCQQGVGRSRDVQLGARRDHRTDQGQHRHPARHSHFRGSADSRHPPQATGPDVHAAQGQRTGTQDPRVLRSKPGPADRGGPIRLRRRLRCADADEGDQRAAGYPRKRPGNDPRPRQCADAHRGGQAHEACARTAS